MKIPKWVKKSYDENERSSWQEILFYERPYDQKNWLKKIWLIIRQVFFVITDKDSHIFKNSAALTQYTVIGIIPLFACLLLLPHFFGPEVSIEKLANNAIPTMHNTWEQIIIFARNSLSVIQDYKIIKIGGPLFVIFSTLFFYNSVQSIFCDIWGTKQRGLEETIKFCWNSFLITILMVVIGALLFNSLPLFVPNWILTFAITLCGIFLGYWYGPNRDYKNFKSVFFPALFSTILIVSFWGFFNFFICFSHSTDYFKYGDFCIFFIFLFFINTSWFLCLMGAVLSISVDKSEWYYKKKQSDDMMLFLKFSLGLMVASCVYRYWNRREKGLTIHQIRIQMFNNDYENKDTKEAEKISIENKDGSWLPLYLLQNVLNDLVRVDILEVDEFQKYKKSSNRKSETTSGDLLFAMLFIGNYAIGYEVGNYIPPVESLIANSILKSASDFKTKLIDLEPLNNPFKKLQAKDLSKSYIEQKLKFDLIYLQYKNGITDGSFLEHLKRAIQDSHFSYEEILNGLKALPETKEIQFAIGIIEEAQKK